MGNVSSAENVAVVSLKPLVLHGWCCNREVRPVWFQWQFNSSSHAISPNNPPLPVSFCVSLSHSLSYPYYHLHPQSAHLPQSYQHHHRIILLITSFSLSPFLFLLMAATSVSSLSSSSCLILCCCCLSCFLSALRILSSSSRWLVLLWSRLFSCYITTKLATLN